MEYIAASGIYLLFRNYMLVLAAYKDKIFSY